MADAVSLLRDKQAKLEAKVKRARASLEAAESELSDTITALRVLTNLGLAPEIEEDQTGADPGMSSAQALVMAAVPCGREFATGPRDIYNIIRAGGANAGITSDYVRTALWRLANKKNLIKSEDGAYWRERDGATSAENVAAPGAETPRADNESAGPVTGRERGYPPSPPEGSIPSGSTPVRARPDWGDLDSAYPPLTGEKGEQS